MFGFKSKDQLVARPQADTAEQPEASAAKNGLFTRLKQRLSKTGNMLTEGMATFVLGKKEIDDALLAELEDRLLLADVGVDATRARETAAIGRRRCADGGIARRDGRHARAR
jgi:fused signal recognition particle receptor